MYMMNNILTFNTSSIDTYHFDYLFSYQDIKNPIPGVSNVSRIYCQQCGYGIWVHLQSSQHCQDCGYSVHSVCLENIMRGCVAEKIRTEPNFIMEICPEKSLPR